MTMKTMSNKIELSIVFLAVVLFAGIAKLILHFNEYLDFVNSFSNYTLSNILYIYEP